MIDTSLIFQRTHTGRTEIHEKRHGLTQSERLVLIMVDGVTPYADVRKKLPVLRDERFARAFATLIQKELIVEVFLPVADQSPEAVERSVIDRFLQQDPLDPVTIIVHDAEEELGASVDPAHSVPPANRPSRAATDSPPKLMAREANQAPGLAAAAEPAMDDLHISLADSLTSELHERQAQSRHSNPGRTRSTKATREARRREDHPQPVPQRGLTANWPYWSIGLGVAFLAGFVVAKLSL